MLLTAYDLRRAPIPSDMPDKLRHIIEAWRTMDAARLAMISVWVDAAHAGHPEGIEREHRDQVFDIMAQLKTRALAAWEIYTTLRGHA